VPLVGLLDDLRNVVAITADTGFDAGAISLSLAG
jgi:hypothetical protein